MLSAAKIERGTPSVGSVEGGLFLFSGISFGAMKGFLETKPVRVAIPTCVRLRAPPFQREKSGLGREKRKESPAHFCWVAKEMHFWLAGSKKLALVGSTKFQHRTGDSVYSKSHYGAGDSVSP